MKSTAVSDSGPLIAFAVSGYVSLLKEVFDKILIPVAVLEELRLDTGLPGGSVLAKIIYQDKWIEVSQFTPAKSVIPDILDPGESSAIALALKEKSILIIDEKKGRRVAVSVGLKIAGSAGILIAAKRKKIIHKVYPIIASMENSGYFFSEEIKKRILLLAGE